MCTHVHVDVHSSFISTCISMCTRCSSRRALIVHLDVYLDVHSLSISMYILTCTHCPSRCASPGVATRCNRGRGRLSGSLHGRMPCGPTSGETTTTTTTTTTTSEVSLRLTCLTRPLERWKGGKVEKDCRCKRAGGRGGVEVETSARSHLARNHRRNDSRSQRLSWTSRGGLIIYICLAIASHLQFIYRLHACANDRLFLI